MPKPVIIGYIPALHAGYKKLFDRHPDATIYVLGEELSTRFDELRKELRALRPQEVVAALQGWGRTAQVLTPELLKGLEKTQPPVIIPDEDVSRTLTKKTFQDITVVPIFLRWDRRAITSKQDPAIASHMSDDEFDRRMIEQSALAGLKSSNLYRRMGAVLVRDSTVLMEAYNCAQPTPHASWIDGDPRNTATRGVSTDVTIDIHAEARVLAEAAKQGIATKGATIYVLDFPCPTCAKLIANSGVSRVCFAQGYAILDGQQVLSAYGVELVQVTGAKLPEGDPTMWVPYPAKKTS